MKKVLFVCLGNICRSPSAEGIFQNMLIEKELAADIFCDSAGTSAYHAGERADARMRKHALKRGHDLKSISRGFEYSDFEEFDLIIAMDQSNYHNILELDYRSQYKDKVKLMLDYSQKYSFKDVPDPYYDEEQGFETVLDILEDACLGLLKSLT